MPWTRDCQTVAPARRVKLAFPSSTHLFLIHSRWPNRTFDGTCFSSLQLIILYPPVGGIIHSIRLDCEELGVTYHQTSRCTSLEFIIWRGIQFTDPCSHRLPTLKIQKTFRRLIFTTFPIHMIYSKFNLNIVTTKVTLHILLEIVEK